MSRPALLLAATLLTAGCASMAPRHERPPLPVAPAYPQTTAQDAAGPAVADIGWRQVFTDARLRQLIELALQGNRDLRVAAATVEQLSARAQAQAASLWPTLNTGVSASRQATTSGNAVTT